MSGFEVTGTNIRVPALFAPAPEGEPTFVFVVDDGSDGKDSSVVVTATLDWVREQFYDFLHDDRREQPVNYLTAYVKLPGGASIIPCTLGTAAGEKRGDDPRIMVSNEVGLLAIYDI